MRPSSTIRILIAAAVLLVLSAPSAYAQCAMCRENAAATGDGGATLNLAILVLLVPTLTLFLGVLIVAIRRRDAEPEPPSPARPRSRAETVLHVRWLGTRSSASR